MGQFSERHAPLEQLVNVVGLVVGHIFDLEMHVIVRELRVPGFTVPF